VSIESRLGAGTTVRIFLAALSGRAAGPPQSMRRMPGAAQQQELVLVVEDEEGVRSMSVERCAILAIR